jgi:hypothetical protein
MLQKVEMAVTVMNYCARGLGIMFSKLLVERDITCGQILRTF